jgi:hypothetical protein
MATTQSKVKETEVVSEQFKRNLDHILIGDEVGPELTIGKYKLTFKAKGSVKAIAHLIGDENRVEAMQEYVRGCLVDDPAVQAAFEELLGKIDMDGLGAIIGVLGEAYTSFPEKS